MLRLCYTLLLCYCVVVQHNDVDALLWMGLYCVAVLTIFVSRALLQLLVAVVAVLGLVWLGAPVNEEEWRELGGLLLVAVGHGLLWHRARSSAATASA